MITVRFSDNRGTWSAPLPRLFFKTPALSLAGNIRITAWQYWVEDAQGNRFNEDGNSGINTHYLDELSDPLLLEMDIDLRMIPAGEYFLVVRFLDSRGKWSPALSEAIEKYILPHAAFLALQTQYCEEGTATFINRSVDADTYLWDFGDSNTSTEINPAHFYGSTGNYTVSLKATLQGNNQVGFLEKPGYISVSPFPQSAFSFQVLNNTVSFSNLSTPEAQYYWSFGEGKFSDQKSPVHTYQSPGEYNTCLAVTTKAGCIAELCQLVAVVTGLENDVSEGIIKAYPVPFHDRLVVSATGNPGWQSLDVYSHDGRRVYSQLINPQFNEFSINTSTWVPGVYLLVIYTHSGERILLKTIRE